MNDGPGRNDAPLVSVVIATYNRAQYVAETIESVLSQSYPKIEAIVIDDGSTDDTAAVVEPFVPKVRYVWQENAERGAARNHGLRLAQGEYIAFLDSDDLWLPMKIEEDIAFLEANPGVGLVYTDSVQIDVDGRELRVVRVAGPSGRVTETLLRKTFVSIGTHLARTALVREIGGFREERRLSGAEDWEMWVRLSLETDFAYDPRVTTKIRTHPQNTMTDAAAMCRSITRAGELLREYEQLATAYGKALKRMDAHLALVNAINYCSRKEQKQSLRFLRDAVSADPRIVLDPRYPYTILRLLKNGLGL